MSESQKIPHTLQDIEIVPGAPLVQAVLEKLKDMDGQRIAKDDSAIVRKGVLALVSVIAELEARIARLETERTVTDVD